MGVYPMTRFELQDILEALRQRASLLERSSLMGAENARVAVLQQKAVRMRNLMARLQGVEDTVPIADRWIDRTPGQQRMPATPIDTFR